MFCYGNTLISLNVLKMDLYRNFIPLSKDCKLNKCDEIGLSFNNCCSLDYDLQVLQGPTKKCKQIIGDGNCFFRALPFNIMWK